VTTLSRCLVPKNYGIYYEESNSWRKSLWDKYYMQTPEQRRQSVEKYVTKAAERFNVNPKTILKWRKREDTKDLPMGPKKIKSTVLLER
jgi:hypothetical protein